ncbi:hypothetical protein PC9H_009894 [Pleurotus ostreatus]|uniref:Major facilitator superfamily (MFS) profile domain-containing protein n=1 Tax=Pleurotus ostreatus TaxID=5322 RepID=A0A8H7DSI2_PLEOS|nr:uncharacterized protein PC9H_009894 [Pleurotus ostreatus]KAF7424586.1 hypothetical protein PC9H_009894 [Pleurotus ostreatus]
MTQAQCDEETPLLQIEQGKSPRSPLPWFQFSLVLFLQLAEPLTSQVIYPFAPQLIRDIGVTNGDEAKVGYYVGMMQSVFFVAQAFTVLHWSSLSDRIGRKPVILTGLFGISLSMYCFGLSSTFVGLLHSYSRFLSRGLCGALNGNIGVIKSMMVEMTDSTNISLAYAYFPIAWSTGATLGPMIGGSFSHPVERFPELFGASEFLKSHPYFLPCAVPATFAVVAWLVTLFLLKETVAAPTPISHLLPFRKRSQAAIDAKKSVLISGDNSETEPEPDKPTFASLLTRRVVVASANYACLSLVDIAFRAIQPLFYSTPVEMGGLGLPPQIIGNILSVFGILNGVIQVFFFAYINDRWGSKRVFLVGLASAIPLFLSFPLLNVLARSQGTSLLVWAVVGMQITISVFMSMSYGAIFIYISASAPSRSMLGATNGLAQTTVSIMRAIGPATANSLFSLSIEKQYLGGWMVYYSLLCVVGTSIFVGSLLPRQIWTMPS